MCIKVIVCNITVIFLRHNVVQIPVWWTPVHYTRLRHIRDASRARRLIDESGAKEATSSSKCSCSGGDGRTKVRPHHSGALRPSFAASLPGDQVQACHDSIQVPAWIGANISGRWLLCNFCYRQQATSPVCWHEDTVRAKDDDNTGTTTPGMRSFAVTSPNIWNSLPAALRTAMLSPLAFSRHLKTHLFDWDWQRVWVLLRMRSTNLRIIIIIINKHSFTPSRKHSLCLRRSIVDCITLRNTGPLDI